MTENASNHPPKPVFSAVTVADPAAPAAPVVKVLTPAAERALAEAAARREALEAQEQALAAAAEVHGRGGKDPVRYGDWEIKGLTADF
jgi:hypothetical protein